MGVGRVMRAKTCVWLWDVRTSLGWPGTCPPAMVHGAGQWPMHTVTARMIMMQRAQSSAYVMPVRGLSVGCRRVYCSWPVYPVQCRL